MGQCCENQKGEIYEFDPQQLKITKFNSERLSDESLHADIMKHDDDFLQKIQQKIVEQEKQQELWMMEIDKKLQIDEEKKQQFVDFQQLIHAYQKCIHHYKTHEIDNSYHITNELSTLKANIKEARQLNEDEFLKKVKEIEQKWQAESGNHFIAHYDQDILETIKLEMKELLHYQNELNRESFIEKYNKKGIKISIRTEGNTIGAQLETDLEVPFEQFSMLLTEVDYFSDFIPFCEKSYLLKDSGRNSKIGYSVFNFPIVTRREGFFKGIAYFRFKTTRDIFLYIRSLQQEELDKEGIDAKFNEDYVPLKYKYFVISYEPLLQRVGKLKFSFCIDSGIHFLPQFVEEYMTKKIGKELFFKLLEISRKFEGSKWEESMKAKPQFFMFIRQQIKTRLEELKQEEDKK